MEPANKSIAETVRNFIINNFLLGQASSFGNTDSLLDKGIIDSTGVLEVIGFLEDTFNIKISDAEMLPENLDSVRNIEQFVSSKISA